MKIYHNLEINILVTNIIIFLLTIIDADFFKSPLQYNYAELKENPFLIDEVVLNNLFIILKFSIRILKMKIK